MNFISRIASVVVFSLGLFACGAETETNDGAIRISSITPQNTSNGSATFSNLEGQPVELEDYRGKKIFLNYWATWCAPCIREIPSLERAASQLGDDYVFLFASDESIEEITTFVDEHGFEGSFIKLNTFFASNGVEGVPSSFLYDVEGNEINGWLGERQWDSPEVLAQLRLE